MHDGSEWDRAKSNNRMITSIAWGVPAVVSCTPEFERTAIEAKVPYAIFAGKTDLPATIERLRPPEVRSLGRTLMRWRTEITAWHRCHFTNGPTEAMNNLVKRVKRVAFGFSNFRNYRVRALLYAGKPDWSKLSTITPR